MQTTVWLRNDFFNATEIRVLNAQAEGDKYVFLFLKLLQIAAEAGCPEGLRVKSQLALLNDAVVRAGLRMLGALELLRLEPDGSVSLLPRPTWRITVAESRRRFAGNGGRE